MIKYTDLKTTNRHNLIDVLPLEKPYTILIEPSGLCNFRCVQCFQSLERETYFTKTRMNMPLDRFMSIMDQLTIWPGEKHKVLKLSMYGEPLINPDFCEMLRIARHADVSERIETTTNASLLAPAISKALVEYQLDYLRVSIYATEQQEHQRITKSTLDIQTIYANLSYLKDLKARAGSEKPFVSCKMLDCYGDDNKRFMKMYQHVADEVYLDKAHGWIGVNGKNFIKGYYGEHADIAIRDLHRNSTPRIACPMAFTTMAVRGNGDVSPCCVDFLGGTTLGNIEEQSLQEIWKSDQWFQFEKLQLQGRKEENPSCSHCDVYTSDYYTRDTIDGFPIGKLRHKNGHR